MVFDLFEIYNERTKQSTNLFWAKKSKPAKGFYHANGFILDYRNGHTLTTRSIKDRINALEVAGRSIDSDLKMIELFHNISLNDSFEIKDVLKNNQWEKGKVVDVNFDYLDLEYKKINKKDEPLKTSGSINCLLRFDYSKDYQPRIKTLV